MGHFRRDFPKGLKGLLEGLSEGTSLEGTSRRDFSKGLLEGLHVFKGVGTVAIWLQSFQIEGTSLNKGMTTDVYPRENCIARTCIA